MQLKILDGKCKMNSEEKAVMAGIYTATKSCPGKLLGDDIHRLIAEAKHDNSEAMRLRVYEQRLYAETMNHECLQGHAPSRRHDWKC